jgi:hypothetical protein
MATCTTPRSAREGLVSVGLSVDVEPAAVRFSGLSPFYYHREEFQARTWPTSANRDAPFERSLTIEVEGVPFEPTLPPERRLEWTDFQVSVRWRSHTQLRDTTPTHTHTHKTQAQILTHESVVA